MKNHFILILTFVNIVSVFSANQLLGKEISAKEDVLKESTDSAGITQRVIKIEGKVDKPRTIFIVPRTKLLAGQEGSTEKYSLDPLFPDLGIADHKK